MTEHEIEYQSVPRLRVLARELEILNAKLIAEGIPGNQRLMRLRHFAAATLRNVKPFVGHIERKGVSPGRVEGTFRAQIAVDGRSRTIGVFDSEHEAYAAYKLAHAEQFGSNSPHSSDYIGINGGDYTFDLDDDGNNQPLPKGVRESGGKFYATRFHDRVAIRSGPFVTIEEAEQASLAAALEIDASIAQKAAA